MASDVYLVEHSWSDAAGNSGETKRIFSAPEKAERYVLRTARKLPGYDRAAERECRNGAAEYACARLGATICPLQVE